jgi:flagellar basal-body rod protein FlgG
MNTPGYRAQRANSATGAQGQGTKVDSVSTSFNMGSLQPTGNPTDLAIAGNGYFPVTGPNGETAYTRDGGFSMDAEGRLVNSQGMPLQPEINVPANAQDVQISEEGMVTANVGGETQELGQIELASFSNEEGLLRQGGNTLAATGASGMPQMGAPGQNGTGYIVSGYLEGSNVDIANEMLSLRQEENVTKANVAVVKTADEMQKELLDM